MAKRVGVADAAVAAYEAERVADAERRAEIARIRAAEEAEKDAATLAWVKDHLWIKRYLPDAEWHLVDRRFPQETAVVAPLGEIDDLKIVVTRGTDHINLVRPGRDASGGWLVGARLCRTLADLGRAIDDDRRAAKRVTPSSDEALS